MIELDDAVIVDDLGKEDWVRRVREYKPEELNEYARKRIIYTFNRLEMVREANKIRRPEIANTIGVSEHTVDMMRSGMKNGSLKMELRSVLMYASGIFKSPKYRARNPEQKFVTFLINPNIKRSEIRKEKCYSFPMCIRVKKAYHYDIDLSYYMGMNKGMLTKAESSWLHLNSIPTFANALKYARLVDADVLYFIRKEIDALINRRKGRGDVK